MLNPKRILWHTGLLALAVAAALGTAPRAQAQDTEDMLACLGALSASHVYITYGYIGSVADGLADERYEPDQVVTLMTEVEGLMDSVITHLGTVRADAEANEQAAIDEIIECCELLQDEAAALQRIAKDDTDNSRRAFETSRNAAWEKISILLNLEE